MGLYECPEGCHETAGSAPFCANDDGDANSKHTRGDRGGPCRAKDPDAPLEYRCDTDLVCIMAVGTPKEQFKGEGTYYDERCDNKCILPGEGAKGEKPQFWCREDADCSLAGVCAPNGKCDCAL